jgi:hypothetical protein
MAAAEDYQQQRLCNALEKMPPFSLENIYQIGDYVVADLKSMRRNKTQPQLPWLLLHRETITQLFTADVLSLTLFTKFMQKIYDFLT